MCYFNAERNRKGGDMGEYLPQYYSTQIGKMGVTKGRMGEYELYSWDAVSDCLGENCSCYSACEYEKKGKCRLQLNYLKGITNIIYRNYKEKLDEPTCFRVGMHLIPMYGILCRLKMEEMMVMSPVHNTKAGIKIHPVYKEIRETIRGIENMWKNLGFVGMMGGDMNPGFKGGDIGDNYYDTMEGDGDVEFPSSADIKETHQARLRRKRDKSKHNPHPDKRRSKE